MKTIELGGREFELYYSTKTMLDVEKRCGDTAKISEWLNAAETSGETFHRLAGLITDLINGAVFKANADITLGLKSGDKRSFIDEEAVAAVMSPADIIKYKEAIFGAMHEGMDMELPEGIPEPDPDLAEVESEKNG